ncbi:MAG: DUF5320 domain-containing protein [Planctomycetota bacterium]
MPGGDGTGPMGMGPMTGRAAGYCAGYGVPGYMNPGPRGGRFAGRGGGGRGWRNRYYATGMPGWARAARGMPAWGGVAPGAPAASPQDEAAMLKEQAEFMEQQLRDIRSRIDELQQQQTEE